MQEMANALDKSMAMHERTDHQVTKLHEQMQQMQQQIMQAQHLAETAHKAITAPQPYAPNAQV